MTNELTPREKQHLHWIQLQLRLPAAGVGTIFTSEEVCRERLVAMRWPDGVMCPKCGAKSPGYLENRQTFHCQTCLHQFTATSSSPLHHSRVAIRNWFIAAELLIEGYVKNLGRAMPTSHDLKDALGISYQAAYSLKKKLLTDLSETNGGLIGCCICIGQTESLPTDIRQGSMDHLTWLLGHLYRQSGRY